MLSNMTEASSILVLAKDVVEKIAAGEVIERPASLIKELIENSLDAGSTQIEIDMSNGGRSLRVLDNGCGIKKNELKLALQRHATSKIRQAEDLWQLNSFGFRGEALASVAAVSDLSIVSATSDVLQGAWKLDCHFGQCEELEEASHAQGTEIRIENLFENLPARLKFLKSEAAEFTQIKKVIKAFALVWPEVSFKIRQRGELLAFWSAADANKRVDQILNCKLIHGTRESNGFKANLFYSSPTEVEKSAQNIWIFVQKRWVQDRTIQAAVMESYRNLLMHGEYPSVVVDLQVPTDEVDVNIHPTKSQVKFINSSQVYQLIYGTLRNSLEKSVPKVSEPIQVTPAADNLPLISENWGDVHYRQKTSFEPQKSAEFSLGTNAENSTASGLQHVSEIRAQPIVEGVWSQFQVLGQSNLTYIIAQSRKSLILVDQHAAHERIVFERLMQGFRKGTLEVQNYLLPLTLTLAADAAEALMSVGSDLEKIGLSIDSMGPETIAVRSAPALLKEAAVEKVLFQISREKLETGESFAIDRVIGDIFATMSCHSVIRAGQSLSHEEMKSLLSQMDEFPFSAFCPHGRPVYVERLFTDIEREFGRIL